MEFAKAKLSDLPFIYSQMEKNFIRDEIRDYDHALKVFSNEKYTINFVCVNGLSVGFMCIWQFSDFTFLEHFVIFADYRGRGYGSAALELLKSQCNILILECEPPENQQQKHRFEFYTRHGMYANRHDYWQPAYRKNGERCYLKLMSSQKLVSFDDTVKQIYREVYQTDYV